MKYATLLLCFLVPLSALSKEKSNKYLIGMGIDVKKDLTLLPNFLYTLDVKVAKDTYIGIYNVSPQNYGVRITIGIK